MNRRDFIARCAGLSLTVRTGKALAQSGPLTRIVFPFSAGGGGDALCRVITPYLTQSLDRNVIVENKTGGDGLIGIKFVKNANPDGTTILVTTGPTMYLLPMVEPNRVSTPPRISFRSRCWRVSSSAWSGASRGDAKDFKGFVGWLKANPKQASFGVPSNGTIPHFTGIENWRTGARRPDDAGGLSRQYADHQRPDRRPFCRSASPPSPTPYRSIRAGGVQILAVSSAAALAVPA